MKGGFKSIIIDQLGLLLPIKMKKRTTKQKHRMSIHKQSGGQLSEHSVEMLVNQVERGAM